MVVGISKIEMSDLSQRNCRKPELKSHITLLQIVEMADCDGVCCSSMVFRCAKSVFLMYFNGIPMYEIDRSIDMSRCWCPNLVLNQGPG